MKLVSQNKGFTLVELIIVISIIAVLASLAFMALSGETAQARDSKRLSDLKTFEDSIATSNGKNKKIDYTSTTLGAVQKTAITTNNGTLNPLRGAYLTPIATGLFDSDVIPTIPRDPRGSPYYGAFLSTTDYQLFGTAENPDTKTPLALVKGSFKAGAIIDVLTDDLNDSALTIKVANPNRFVKGDLIKIDNEEMTVESFNNDATSVDVNKVTVTRAGTKKVHNKAASIKLITPITGADSLVCLGNIYKTSETTFDNTTKIDTVPEWDAAMVGTAAEGIICKTGTTNPTITDGSANLPYLVTAE